jgi:hypothetical protein
MSFFVHATEAKQVKSKNAQIAGIVVVAFLIIMVVAQLFTYEKFADVIRGLQLPIADELAPVVAALIVTLEVAMLPFLLRMRLSPLARIVSMVAGWAVLLFWLVLSFWVTVTFNIAPNSGVLGDTIALPAGAWMLTFFMALSVLDGWASYVLWPDISIRKKN